MQNEDKRLLEMAAHVAGVKINTDRWDDDDGFGLTGQSFFWNPLVYDGDALLLAVKLKLHIIHNDPTEDVLWVYAVLGKTGIYGVHEFLSEDERDLATRLAITRAAAAMAEK